MKLRKIENYLTDWYSVPNVMECFRCSEDMYLWYLYIGTLWLVAIVSIYFILIKKNVYKLKLYYMFKLTL